MESSSASSKRTPSSSSVDSPGHLTPTTCYDELSAFHLAPNHAFPLYDYIPLGCLTGSHGAPTLKRGSAEWEEIHQANLISALPDFSDLASLLGHLLEAQWIRLLVGSPSGVFVLRVYVLPEDLGHITIDRSSKALRLALSKVVEMLDISKTAWKGRPQQHRDFELWATTVDHSLFYLFNTLPSPSPVPGRISNRFSRLAAEELLEQDTCIPGLTAKLFRYQARSAAAMIEREATPQQNLDPRFEPRTAPDGRPYYYNPREMLIRRDPVYYECNRGGILAETMGVGKTLICLALILATKYHLYVKLPCCFSPSSLMPTCKATHTCTTFPRPQSQSPRW
jgi:hypothetical protein